MVTIMTIAAAWLAQRADGREHLYIASDSRLSGGQRLDACPKILTLPRSDCALCFAGDTAATYPLMIQMAYAISAHEPARERSLDIARVKANLIRVFSDLVARITDAARPFQPHDAEFIFAGYSWMKKEFRIWNIHYVANEKKFAAREAHSFHPRLPKAAFIGDWSKRIRGQLTRRLQPRMQITGLLILSLVSSRGPESSAIASALLPKWRASLESRPATPVH